MKLKFIKEPENDTFGHDRTKVEMTCDHAICIHEIVDEFALFLKACGFAEENIKETLNLEE